MLVTVFICKSPWLLSCNHLFDMCYKLSWNLGYCFHYERSLCPRKHRNNGEDGCSALSPSCCCFLLSLVHLLTTRCHLKNLPANAGDARDSSSTCGLRRSPGGGNDNPLQYSCLGNPVDREPGGLQAMGLQRVGHDWAHTHRHTDTHTHTHTHTQITGKEPYSWWCANRFSHRTYFC